MYKYPVYHATDLEPTQTHPQAFGFLLMIFMALHFDSAFLTVTIKHKREQLSFTHWGLPNTALKETF